MAQPRKAVRVPLGMLLPVAIESPRGSTEVLEWSRCRPFLYKRDTYERVTRETHHTHTTRAHDVLLCRACDFNSPASPGRLPTTPQKGCVVRAPSRKMAMPIWTTLSVFTLRPVVSKSKMSTRPLFIRPLPLPAFALLSSSGIRKWRRRRRWWRKWRPRKRGRRDGADCARAEAAVATLRRASIENTV